MVAAGAHARPGPPRDGTPWFWVAVLAGLIGLVVGMADTVNLAVDDVFISFRYAENLVRGLGLVFNPGERVEGYSNPLWTLLLAGFAKLGFRGGASPFALLVPAKLAGGLFGLATFAVLAAYAAGLTRRAEWGRYGALLGLPLLVLGASYSFATWSISGMETPMAAFFVTAALTLQLGALRRFDDGAGIAEGRLAAGAALFGLAALVRPEPIFVWALATTALAATAPRPLRRAVLRAAAITLAIYGASAVWRFAYYGALLPNSVVAKTGGGLHAGVLGLKYTLAGVFASVGALALGLLGLPELVRARREWAFLAAFVAAYLLFAIGSGGDWMPGYRLLVPVLPALALLASVALVRAAGRLTPPVPASGIAVGLAVLAVLSFASERNLVRAQRAFPSGFKQVTWQSSPLRIEVAHALGRAAVPGAVVALAECGYIPYLNPDLRFMDVLGLMDHDFARMPAMDVDYFLKRDPEFYLVMVRWGRPSRESVPLLASEAFRRRYRQVAYFDGLRSRLRAMEAGQEPVLEEDQSFLLFRRR